MPSDRQPLLVELYIPYCIRKEPFRKQLQLVGSNAEKNAYMEALKRELLSWEGELDGYEVEALRLSGGSATVICWASCFKPRGRFCRFSRGRSSA